MRNVLNVTFHQIVEKSPYSAQISIRSIKNRSNSNFEKILCCDDFMDKLRKHMQKKINEKKPIFSMLPASTIPYEI